MVIFEMYFNAKIYTCFVKLLFLKKSMMIIELKKKKESPVGTIILTTLLCWGPIVFLLWVYFTAKHRDGIFFLLFLCFGLMVVGIYSIYSGKRMTPKIELDDEKILMNNKYYYWKDLVSIDLWGSIGVGRGRLDGTILTFYTKKEMIYLRVINRNIIKTFYYLI